MVGGAMQQQQQPSQLALPSSSTVQATTTEEEEFLKRNTDCVYFLASPLTCKKGSECEYRHSDIARVNPRDCWYWLNGNCLNPKCGFRHPPLDGLLGAEVPTPVAPSVPQPPSKQGVACIFFQKGFCLKGHLCPFLHGPPNTLNNKAAQPPPPNPATKLPKMASAPPEKQPENVQKPVEFLPPQRKQAPAPARNGGAGGAVSLERIAAPPHSDEPPRYRPAAVAPPPVMNEFPANWSNHVSDNDSILNGKDADEYSREPTPGFDVLVDNELGDSEFYHNEEQFGRSNSHDFDMDRDIYNEQRDYDSRYAWEDHGSASLERKRYHKDESPDRFDQSDLRHRISKQRRGNNVSGLRSVVSREHSGDWRDMGRDRDSHHHYQHRQHHRPDQGSSGNFSSRLRGRIKIPTRSVSPGNENELGRLHLSRYSPRALSNQSRLRDRIKGRLSEDYDNDRKFSGPRRLSELKRGYEDQKDDRESVLKRKFPRLESQSQQSEDNLSFEGPKPLSEILKRKRGVESTVLDNRVSSVINEDNNNLKEIKTVINEDNNNSKEIKEKQTDLTESGLNHVDEDEMLDKELEAYDHRDGDYDFEQIDGEDYNLDEGEEEYMDGDEYGKKESDVYS